MATPELARLPESPARILPVRADTRSPRETPSDIDEVQPTPRFLMAVYSADVSGARSFALGPKGVVFLSTREDDRVYALVDTNGDHRVDRVQVVARGLQTPNGLEYRDGALFVAEIGRILRIDGIDDVIENAAAPAVREQASEREHQGWRYIRFGPDGWLYIPADIAQDETRVTGDLRSPTVG